MTTLESTLYAVALPRKGKIQSFVFVKYHDPLCIEVLKKPMYVSMFER
jgi:hypothetical protein